MLNRTCFSCFVGTYHSVWKTCRNLIAYSLMEQKIQHFLGILFGHTFATVNLFQQFSAVLCGCGISSSVTCPGRGWRMKGTVAACLCISILFQILVYYRGSFYKTSASVASYQLIVAFIVTDCNHIPQKISNAGTVLHFSLSDLIVGRCHDKSFDGTCRIHCLIIYIHNISGFQIFYVNGPVSSVSRRKMLHLSLKSA